MDRIVIVLVMIAVTWSLWGYFSSRVEQAAYSVLKKAKGYEIRRYPAHLEAQTVVNASYDEALGRGFSTIAAYIFGNNKSRTRVDMTAPVLERTSQKIAMTAPVSSRKEGAQMTVAFVMPSEYTIDTLPEPEDPRVKITEVPEQSVAALRFSWYRSARRIASKKDELLALLKRDGITVEGEPAYAGYNAPWSPPWLNRHEVLIKVSVN